MFSSALNHGSMAHPEQFFPVLRFIFHTSTAISTTVLFFFHLCCLPQCFLPVFKPRKLPGSVCAALVASVLHREAKGPSPCSSSLPKQPVCAAQSVNCTDLSIKHQLPKASPGLPRCVTYASPSPEPSWGVPLDRGHLWHEEEEERGRERHPETIG